MAGFFPTQPPAIMDPATAQKLMNPGAPQAANLNTTFGNLGAQLQDAFAARARRNAADAAVDDTLQDAQQDAEDAA